MKLLGLPPCDCRVVQPHQVSWLEWNAMSLAVVELFLAFELAAHALSHTSVGSLETRSEVCRVLGYCGWLWGGSSKHNIHRHTYLATEHEEKGGVSSRRVDTGVIRQAQAAEMALPVEWVFTSCSRQHIEERAIESLD